ncbi:phosphate/phosphite/phosphonate ABC transporter substrate-binding protein [Vreelandella azerica]|uniref:phosphate/phosphite/phosphonate ABC transporter substrate-binding protein n=1 Tax=Vreelandella azerica TaxID=2732867 RepID=UPI002E2A96E1|nr:PhnD/SsuA/transferrin family substrate-binding protein [Halomonas azerica]
MSSWYLKAQRLRGWKICKGRTSGCPANAFLGGFLTQVYELEQKGFDSKTFADYRELGGHDAVISALLSGDVEAGFVRSGIVEDWLAQGRLQPGQLSVIEAHPADPYFPLVHSTRLYPEWALAAMPHVPMEDIRRVSNALLQLNGVLAKRSSLSPLTRPRIICQWNWPPALWALLPLRPKT